MKAIEVKKLKTDLQSVLGERRLQAGETILDVMARLDAGAQSSQVSQRLRHYLERRSYVKALEFIEDPGKPHQL